MGGLEGKHAFYLVASLHTKTYKHSCHNTALWSIQYQYMYTSTGNANESTSQSTGSFWSMPQHAYMTLIHLKKIILLLLLQYKFYNQYKMVGNDNP